MLLEDVMRRSITATIVALALLGTTPVIAPAAPPPITYKSCSGGFRHAVINGSHKCLRRGQFCARAADSQYHRYGLHCHKRDTRGAYHLT